MRDHLKKRIFQDALIEALGLKTFFESRYNDDYYDKLIIEKKDLTVDKYNITEPTHKELREALKIINSRY